MFHTMIHKTWILAAVLPLAVTHGCEDKTSQIAREAADRQAQQNTEMAQLNKEVASGSHQLVQADAQARKEIVGVHHELLAERTRLDTGWDQLEDERRRIASERRAESTFVSVAKASGYLFLVIVVLGFCWYALFGIRRGDGADAQLNELLIEEILPEQPPLLPFNQLGTNLLGHSQPEEHAAE